MKNETIAAIATPRGQAGIGVIRVSGEDSISVVDRVFKSISGARLEETRGYSAHYGHVTHKGENIDEAVCMVYRAPRSYTGENVVEISCHGGLYTTRKVLEAVLENGAVPAAGGEFTKRAFLNNKMSLTEAESVMNIIEANGYQAAKAALASREGALDRKISSIILKLTDIAAHLDAWADYPEDDIAEVDEKTLGIELTGIVKEISHMLKNFEKGRIMREGINTAIVGRPNVGKSTLMNLLAGCEKSIVTKVPGTTRDIVEERVFIGDVVLNLSDTAGIRDTDDDIEKIGVDKTRRRIEESELVLAVFDTSAEFSSQDKQLTDILKGVPTIAVINKSDLEDKFDSTYLKANIDKVIKISAKSEDGIQNLEKAILETTRLSNFDPSQAMIFNRRQKTASQNAHNVLKEAIEALEDEQTLDAVTVLIEEALDFLLELSGKRVSDTVVENVFSQFCVGK